MRRARRLCLLATLALAASASPAQAANPPLRLSTDPYTGGGSFHATEVEPDSFADGQTIVAAFQVGRSFSGGATNIGWARSADGGQSWTHGFLDGITTGGGGFARGTDAAVAYDRKHDTWLIETLALDASSHGAAVVVSLSTDGGASWGAPVSVRKATSPQDFDKSWLACDNHAKLPDGTTANPYYGRCYSQWDDFGDGDRLLMSTSSDGGLTWGTPVRPAGNPAGLGGQPVVQPNGHVVVPFASAQENAIGAFVSTDGGVSWDAPQPVADVSQHLISGSIRSGPLPSAEVAGDGRVFVAWQDCRFRAACGSNDIVYSSSADGTTWGAPARVPVDAVTSGVDHFVPGLAVDPATSGASTHLSLTYHYLSDASCFDADSCRLNVAMTSSSDAGAHWSTPRRVAGPMAVSWLVPTSEGYMFGDYVSTSFTSDGIARGVFAAACAPSGGTYDEAIFAASETSSTLACPTGPDDRPPVQPPPDTPPPGPRTLAELRIAPKRFRARRRGPSIARALGAIVSYRASSAGTTTFTLRRAVRRHGSLRFKSVRGKFRHADRAGANRFRFSGRLRGRLRPGVYRLAGSPGGTGARAVHARFRILSAKRARSAR